MTEFLGSRYRLIEVLGQGSMGVVWRAQDTVLDRSIAIKELRPPPGVDPLEALDRFLVEARAAARLTHPNIVAVHDVFADGERVLIAMELVEGPTLDDVLAVSGAQPAAEVRAVMAQVAQALVSAHGAGVVHRDLKPGNVFWTGGRAVVCDFGLARIGAGRGTVEGTVMGTPGYMSPEQVRGLDAGPATDVFAWGAVAYEMATGRAPFGDPDAADPTALAYRVVHEDPLPLDLPDDPLLGDLITRCLAKDPSLRPRDGNDLCAELAELPAGMALPATDSGPLDYSPDLRAASSRHGRALFALAGSAVVLAVVLGIAFVSFRGGRAAPGSAPLGVGGGIADSSLSAPSTLTPLRLPDGSATPGHYSTGLFQPVAHLELGDGWLSHDEREDTVNLARTNFAYPWLTLLRIRGIVDPAWQGPAVDGSNAQLIPPNNLGSALQDHNQIVAVSSRNPLAGIAGTWDLTLREGAGYRSRSCERCVELFALDGETVFLLQEGQKARLYVFSGASEAVVVATVMPVDQFDEMVPLAEGVVRTIRFSS